MTKRTSIGPWLPRVAKRSGPFYRAIADALEADVREGRLTTGDSLPTQRELAERLGVNFTTVTRAYAEARRRGLITAHVGRGTFVAGPARTAGGASGRPGGDIDLSVNAPPIPPWMPGALQNTLARIGADPAIRHNILSYESRQGSATARHAGLAWLEGRGLAPSLERVVPAAGAQHALSMLMADLARPGDTVLVEALAYPALVNIAATAGVRLVGVEIDGDGLRPDALSRACRRHRPKALFCVPTLQNPTTAVMPLERRHAILEVARRYNLRIVEDDICGPLFADAPPPLAALGPDIVVYVGSLSKCVAPGLRTAFVLPPSVGDANRLNAAVRASLLMLSPLPVAVAVAWIADGTAARAVTDIRQESTARAALARRIFGDRHVAAPPGSLHAWLELPAAWTVASFVAQAQQHGIRIAPADWYVMPTGDERAAPRTAPTAVRLTLGVVPDRATLERALRVLAAVAAQPAGVRASTL